MEVHSVCVKLCIECDDVMVLFSGTVGWVLIFFMQAFESMKNAKSVVPGQCDARPAVTYPNNNSNEIYIAPSAELQRQCWGMETVVEKDRL